MKRRNQPISVRSGQIEFLKLNTETWEWRDAYQWLLSLSWPQFAAFVGGVYLGLNCLFRLPLCAGRRLRGRNAPRAFRDAFFFSVQTLATVGYGHLYPTSLYGNIISTIEIMTGLFLIAVMTGLIFVRFSGRLRGLYSVDRL
jgi:inward rectifier potassium channel